MAHSPKYGPIDIPGVPEDEPVFILRAKDPLAFYMVREYAAVLEQCRHVGPERYAETKAEAEAVRSVAHEMATWFDRQQQRAAGFPAVRRDGTVVPRTSSCEPAVVKEEKSKCPTTK